MKVEVQIVDLKSESVGKDSLEIGEMTGGSRLFGQYLHVLDSSSRVGNAQTKSRGEVSGGGKKPWKQKGTGRARQGSIRSPLWRGGGVAHGPETRDYGLKFNKKSMKAVWTFVLTAQVKKNSGWLILKDSRETLKSKEAHQFLKNMGKEKDSVLLVSDRLFLKRAFRNLENTVVESPTNLNPRQISLAQTLITDEAAFEKLKSRVSNKI